MKRRKPRNFLGVRLRTSCAAGGAGWVLSLLVTVAARAEDVPRYRIAPSLYDRYPDATQLPADQLRLRNDFPRFDPFQALEIPPPGLPPSQPVPTPPMPAASLSPNLLFPSITHRVAELPTDFARHPVRNLAPPAGAAPYTLRTTSASDVQAQLSLALQTDFRYDDNLANLPFPFVVHGAVGEYTPSIRLNVGSSPGLRNERSMLSDYYFQGLYLPTIYDRLDQGTARTLQRIILEGGRATARSVADVRFEYDENLVGAAESVSPEDTYTLLEVSPLLISFLSAKTSVRAQAFYRRITVQNSNTNRDEYVLDAGIECETSVKTTVGMGTEIGRITFDDSDFPGQNYGQFYLSWAWKASPKITFQTRTGVEIREYAGGNKPTRVSPVTKTALNWQPNDRTQINLGLRVQNQPSVSETGALFQEVRFAADFQHELGWNLYFRGEFALDHRNYDSEQTVMDVVFQPAFGYHTGVGRLMDSVNIEVYYQRQQTYSNQRDANFDRNMFGLRTTVYF